MSAAPAPAPARRCAVCTAPVATPLCTAETIGRDLARARRGVDGRLHDDAVAVYWCGSCGSTSRDPLAGRDDNVTRYARCRYDRDTLAELCRLGRASLERDPGRLRARGVVAGARLLEIGSYAGAFLEVAREAGCHATGIDVNADVVAHGAERGLDIRGGTFEPSSFAAGGFDGVWILNCFEQLPDHGVALAGAARVLRPGGTLVIRTPNAEFLRLVYATPPDPRLRAVADANGVLGVPFAKCFSAPALAREIEAHGLAVVGVEGRGPPAPWLEVTARRLAPGALRWTAGPRPA
jgi:SAM-dependent methyltransferase